jgi:hypothetical protein
MKSTALFLAMLAAALSCAPGDDVMTSNKQSYSVPFNPNVPPVFPASTINDEYRAQSPIIDTGGPRKVVALDPKWDVYLPGAGSTLAATIDPTRQMLQISGVQPKQWAGVMQDLPLPGVGESLGYTLITRMMNGFVLADGNTDYGPLYFGLLIGNALKLQPDTTQLWAICTELLRTSGSVDGRSITAELADYASPIVADGDARSAEYLSCEVQASQAGPGVYTADISFGVSANGIFFQRLFSYLDVGLPLRQFALAQWTVGVPGGVGTFSDYIRFFPTVPGDDIASDPPIGEILHLGSV